MAIFPLPGFEGLSRRCTPVVSCNLHIDPLPQCKMPRYHTPAPKVTRYRGCCIVSSVTRRNRRAGLFRTQSVHENPKNFNGQPLADADI